MKKYKADPCGKDEFVVKEVYEGPKLETIPGRPASQVTDFVDEGIVKSCPKQYEPFHAYVEAHAEQLYPGAIAAYPNAIIINPQEFEAAKEPEVEKEEPEREDEEE